MCTIYTIEEYHATNIRAMRETWAPYCDGFLVFSTRNESHIPSIAVPHDGPEAYFNMWQKVRSMWRFVRTHYLDEFDFFYQGGDDMYAIPHHLKRFLQEVLDREELTAEDDLFAGQRYRNEWSSGHVYNTGGPGYVLSRGTLRKYVDYGWNHTACSPDHVASGEDIIIAHCLRDLFQIEPYDTRDKEQRQRFHHATLSEMISLWKDNVTGILSANLHDQPPLGGKQVLSPSTVALHYVKNPATLRHIHALIYQCQ